MSTSSLYRLVWLTRHLKTQSSPYFNRLISPLVLQHHYRFDVFIEIDPCGVRTDIGSNKSLSMRAALISHGTMSRGILRREDSGAALLSKAATDFVYNTRCTLQRAHISMLRALIRARFKLLPKCSFKIGYYSLLLQWTLEVCDMVLMWLSSCHKVSKF